MATTFGSLFAGIGGIDLGFERAGMECKWQVEIDDYATKVLEKHWPEVRRHRDIRTFPPEPIDEWRVDLICGGDPCQANSGAAGPHRSEQQSLGGEFIRVVDALRPEIVVRENPRHVRKDAPWPWQRFRSELESIGYAVLPFRLRACCFGAIHQRDRMFLLGQRADTIRDGLERWQTQKEERDASKPAGRMDANDWLAAYSAEGYGSRHDVPNIVDRLRCLGNAVVPQVAEWIGRQICDPTNATH